MMKDYSIKKLLVRDRGIKKGTMGKYMYSHYKLKRFESLLDKTEQNIKNFNKFKKAVENKEDVDVSQNVCYTYAGFVLDNNLVVNMYKKDKFLDLGEVVATPKGRVRFIGVPDGYKRSIDRSVNEDLSSITESIYDYDYDNMVLSLLYGPHSFMLNNHKAIVPKVLVSAPTIKVKEKYRDYFYLISIREKLLSKMKGQTVPTLRQVVIMDEGLPEEYRNKYIDKTPEERVYSYVCDNPAYMHSFNN